MPAITTTASFRPWTQVNTTAGTQGTDDFWMKMYDVFAQDTWTVNRKLTVTAGVRCDLQIDPAAGQD